MLTYLADDEPLVPVLLAQHAAAAAAAAKEKEKEERRARSKARAGLRKTPCLGCVRSALKGMSTGQCWETAGRGARCFRCSQGHTCVAVPAHLSALARRLVGVLVDPSSSDTVKHNHRVAMRIMLSLEQGEDEDDDDDNDDDDDEEPVVRRRSARLGR